MKTLEEGRVTDASEFDLDVRVVTDLSPNAPAPCGTDDGCAPTCASSCISNA